MFSSISAPTRSTSRRALSSSIRARMAIAARIAPMSSCRARPIPRNPASMSIPKAACSWPSGRIFRRAMRARIGRSCARFRRSSARRCRSIRCTRCGRSSLRDYPHFAKIDAIAPGDPADIAQDRRRRRDAERCAFRLAGRGFLSSPIRSRAPRLSWPNVRRWRAAHLQTGGGVASTWTDSCRFCSPF